MKDRLLEAASGFATLGYVEFSVAQILSRAGVQAPTLYHHFGDKEGLFVEWAVAAMEAIDLTPNSDGFDAGLQKIACEVRAARNPDILQLAKDANKLDRAESRERVLDALQRCLYEPLYALLLEGMAKGRLRREPVHPAAAVFLTGAVALRSGGLLEGAGEQTGPDWWVERFVSGFGV